jgi:NADP-dependent 3-hydroxy acid dehydrogenase YdfG
MTGSNASLRGYPNWSVYAASKAVFPAYARVWVSELRDRKIRVNVLTPGQVATSALEEVMDEETKAQFESVIPRRMIDRPEEIASVALILASDNSSYVNGMSRLSTAALRSGGSRRHPPPLHPRFPSHRRHSCASESSDPGSKASPTIS